MGCVPSALRLQFQSSRPGVLPCCHLAITCPKTGDHQSLDGSPLQRLEEAQRPVACIGPACLDGARKTAPTSDECDASLGRALRRVHGYRMLA